MDPEQIFQEEYSEFLSHVSDVSSLLVTAKQVGINANEIKQKFIDLASQKSLSSAHIDQFISLLQDSTKAAQDLLSIATELHPAMKKSVEY